MTTDQKRALGIGAVGVVGLLALSRMRTKGKSTTTLVSASGATTPYTPQAPLPLTSTFTTPSGATGTAESVYDPNSQVLLTAPTPVATADNTPGLGSQTTAPSAPSYSVNVNYPTPVARTSHSKKPTKRKPTKTSNAGHTKKTKASTSHVKKGK